MSNYHRGKAILDGKEVTWVKYEIPDGWKPKIKTRFTLPEGTRTVNVYLLTEDSFQRIIEFSDKETDSVPESLEDALVNHARKLINVDAVASPERTIDPEALLVLSLLGKYNNPYEAQYGLTQLMPDYKS